MNVTAFLKTCAQSRNCRRSPSAWKSQLLLRRGETYAAIAEKTGASTATISRVNRCLSYGADGYQTVLRRLSEGKPE